MTEIPPDVLRALDLPTDAVAAPAGGESGARVWRVTAGGRTYALRLMPAFALMGMRSQAAAASAARAGGVPVPAIVGIRSGDTWAAMLTEWCAGTPVAPALFAGASPAGLGRACGAVQARLHAVCAPTALHGRRSWATPTPEEAEILKLAAPPATEQLVHFDLHPLNILTLGGSITGVIDWENATAGDPRQDLARSLAVVDLVMRAATVGSPELASRLDAFSAAWLETYEAIRGPVERLSVFLAWAALRTIRDLDGKRSQEEIARMRTRADAWVKAAKEHSTIDPAST